MEKQTVTKILNEIEIIQGKEPSNYFTDAHIDGYDHAISDVIAIINKIKKEYELYNFEELDQQAKDKAIETYNANNDYPFLSDYMNERLHELLLENDIKDLNDTSKPNTRPTPVLYDLSYCQGDGAMFQGDFQWNGYNITIKHRGNYYHSNCKSIEIYKDENELSMDADNNIYDAFEEIYQDICTKLEKYGYAEIEYQNSKEYFAETCIANEYTFLKDGTMANY